MPLITLPNTTIEIESDVITIADQQLKRVLHVVRMEYNVENKCVTVEGIISFKNSDDEHVQTAMIRPYAARIIADNTMYCDLMGDTLCAVSDEYLQEEVQEGQEPQKHLNPLLEDKDYMTEFEWFFNLANTQSVIVNDLIKQFLTKALNAGRFN